MGSETPIPFLFRKEEVSVKEKIDRLCRRMGEKELRIPVDLTAGVVFFLLGAAVMLLMPSQVAVSERDVVNGRAFPELLMTLMMICCAGLIVKDVVKIIRKQPLTYKTINLLTEVKALIIIAILVITYLLCRATDLFVVGAVFCALAFLIFFKCKKPLYYVITVGMAVGIWAAFRFLLNVRF